MGFLSGTKMTFYVTGKAQTCLAYSEDHIDIFDHMKFKISL